MKTLVVKRPIEQQICKRRDFYELLLVPKRSMSLAEYRATVEPDERAIRGLTDAQVEERVG